MTAYGEAGADLLYGSQGNDDPWLDGGPGQRLAVRRRPAMTRSSQAAAATCCTGGEGDDTYTVSEASVWLEDSAGDDTVVVQASWVKDPKPASKRGHYAAVDAKPLPYWLDAMLADNGAAWISSLVGSINTQHQYQHQHLQLRLSV